MSRIIIVERCFFIGISLLPLWLSEAEMPRRKRLY
jgi:hypothetical protein